MAILAKDSVPDAVESLIRQKEKELTDYKDALKKEEQSVRLLVEALELPTGTIGREIADGIALELRECFPDEARAADERIAQKKRVVNELNQDCAR